MKKEKIAVLAIGLLLVFSLAFVGCIGEDDEENDDDNGEYEGTGTETYSGTWEGEDLEGNEYEGTWEFTVDWEDEDVSGWFEGDAEGDIDGSVSEGEITAEGEAGLGYVTWEGTFSPDGSSISGDWEIEAGGYVAYSGTWSGTKQ